MRIQDAEDLIGQIGHQCLGFLVGIPYSVCIENHK